MITNQKQTTTWHGCIPQVYIDNVKIKANLQNLPWTWMCRNKSELVGIHTQHTQIGKQ